MKRPFDRGAVRLARHVSRALLLRCPVCGGGSLFTRWVHMKPVCPRCGLRTDRGEADYFIGGYTVNFVTAELTAAVGMLIVVVATWPTVPWRGLMWGGVALMVALPIAFYPYSRTLWLAIDLTFRPPHEGDFTARPGPASTPARREG